jgi:glycosyltransferase involved in cell wall biosynthesis/O-antigen/teichoic acid export membrane protein
MSASDLVLPSPGRRSPRISASPLRVSFVLTLGGSGVFSACNWAIILILAKFGSPVMAGQFALGLAISVPVLMLSNLQLRGIQVTDARSEYDFTDYFTLRTIATALGLGVVIGIALCSGMDLSRVVIVSLVAMTKAIEALSDVVAGLLQKTERLDHLATILATRGLLSMLAFAYAFWTFHSLVAAVSAIAIASASILILYELPLAARISESTSFLRFRWQILKQLTAISLPLGAVMALGSLNLNLSRYALEYYGGTRQLGIFASLAYIGTSASFVVNALGQSASARLARMFADRDFAGFSRLVRKFISFAALIAAIGLPIAAILGKRILTILYQAEYTKYVSVLLIMIATTSIGAVASFLGYGMTSARCFKLQLWAMCAATAVTAVVTFWLVPRFGIMGAAWSLMVAALLQVVALGLLMQYVIARAKSKKFVGTKRPLALFSPSLAGGGAERVLLNLAAGLQQRGHQIDIVLSRTSGEYAHQVPTGVNVVDLAAKRMLTCLPGLIRYIRKERPSGVIAFQDHASVVAFCASTLAGLRTPIIPTVHNTWSRVLESGSRKTRLLAKVASFVYKRIPRIVAVSEGAAADLTEQLHLRRDLVNVIYNPVVTPELFEKATEPVGDQWFEDYKGAWIMGIGRLTKQKDFSNLIQAFSSVRKGIDCKLLILGEGEERPNLEHLIRRLHLENDCFMPGFVDNPYSYLSRAALFVLSSAWEGLPTVLIEALALGVRVVSTDCKSGPREILGDGQFGLLVPPSDPVALSAAMANAFLHPRAIPDEAVTPFVASTAIQRYEALLEALHAS